MTHQQSRRAAYGSRRHEQRSYILREPLEAEAPGGRGMLAARVCEVCGGPAEIRLRERWHCLDCLARALPQ
ncbi:MAG: hypothetical protein ACLQBX_04670 [Candidatus Limnocylindrales bacterium]